MRFARTPVRGPRRLEADRKRALQLWRRARAQLRSAGIELKPATTAHEAAARVLENLDAGRMLAELVAERRAVKVRLAGEERWIDAADAGLYRDALGVALPGGLPAAFIEDVPDALIRLARRYAASRADLRSPQRL